MTDAGNLPRRLTAGNYGDGIAQKNKEAVNDL